MIFMLYPYAEFPGELSITYSQIIPDPSQKDGIKIYVHFEKPTDYGFKEARYTLPTIRKFIIITLLIQKQRTT